MYLSKEQKCVTSPLRPGFVNNGVQEPPLPGTCASAQVLMGFTWLCAFIRKFDVEYFFKSTCLPFSRYADLISYQLVRG